MNVQSKTNGIPHPQLIGSLRAGFDTVANHIGLILFPVALDLFLWFGPHFQVKPIVSRMLAEITANPAFNTPQMSDMIKSSQAFWSAWADHFNLASALRAFPVGVSSLMTSIMPLDTPLGTPAILSIGSLGRALVIWILFSLVGLILGSLYFSAVARAIHGQNIPSGVASDLWDALQVVFLAISVIVVLSMILIPAFFLLALLALISLDIAQFAIIIVFLVMIWILVPLLFSPHGIFVYRQNAWRSMLTSVRLVRFILPGTGLFFLAILVLSQGLDLLWQVPATNSWMSLVGIAGHAFVTTGLLASSFVYYRDAMHWVQEFLQRKLVSPSQTSPV